MSQVTESHWPDGYPADLETSFLSRTGEQIAVRPILPSDASRLQDLFHSLSPESIYRRFFSYRRDLPGSEARQLSMVDYRLHLALVAYPVQDPEQIVGVARFAPTEEREGAVEMAIVVRDAFQNYGIGRFLFKALAEAARERGYRWMLVETQSDNQPMIELAERVGYTTVLERDTGMVRLWLDLRA
jgi:GNAT superfamily N-acetyltransferase